MSQSVLLVDDDEMVRRLWKRGLESEGWNVIEKVTGQQAIEFLSSPEGKIVTGVISDLEMPVADGFAVIRHVKQMRPAPWVVLVTGRSPEEIAVWPNREEPHKVVHKPTTLARFLSSIAAICS